VVNFTGTSGPRKLTGILSGSVAAGSTDAINGGQFFDLQTEMRNGINGLDGRVTTLEGAVSDLQFDMSRLNQDMNSGMGSVSAMAAMPMSINPGKLMMTGGLGYRSGRFGGAVGFSYRTADDTATFNIRTAYDKKATVGAGAGIEF